MAFRELELDEIGAIRSSARVRGLYKEQLGVFAASGSEGAEVDLTEEEFAGKKPDSVYQGFAGALRADEELAAQVRVVKVEDRIYLISKVAA